MSRLSVVADTAGCTPETLAAFCRSLLNQRDPRWELFLCVDPQLVADARAAAAADPRITLVDVPAKAAALRAALTAATGNVVTVLDPWGYLSGDAVGALIDCFDEDPATDVVYTDEEWGAADDGLAALVMKPGWSPHYLQGCDYVGRLTAYRTSLVRGSGGLRDVPAVAREWDLALRATALARGVVHLRRVLYHGLRPPPSARGDAPSDTDASALEHVLVEHLARTDPAQTPEPVPGTPWFRVRRPFRDWPSIGVVLTTAGTRLPGSSRMRIRDCLDDLFDRTEHGPLDVCVVISGNARDGVEDELSAEYGDRLRCRRLRGGFNYSRSINAGARAVVGELLLLLNDDIRVREPSWLRRLAERALDPRVGVVGGKLLFPDGRIQHVGVMHDDDGPYHFAYAVEDGPGYQGDTVLDMEYLAVTGACHLMRRELFERAGGYDTEMPVNYNDIDFCLKVNRGLRLPTVQVNAAVLIHAESSTRGAGVHPLEAQRFRQRWDERGDPHRRERIDVPGARHVPTP